MIIVPLDDGLLPAFTAYCRRHRGEVDESFLYDEQLDAFRPDGDNPAAVALDETGAVRGAGALILDEHHRRGGRGRFRILHCEGGAEGCYSPLFDSLLPHAAGLRSLTLFVPEQNAALLKAADALGFTVERYSWFLVRERKETGEVSFPPGFALRTFVPGRDEPAWCAVRNAAFATLRGSETPITPARAAEMLSGPDALPGGGMMLLHGGEAVAVVRVGRDTLDGEPVAEIGPLAVLPTYQGLGLGRALLRAALRFSHERGFAKTALCVNAENERAAKLYFDEEFVKAETAVCLGYAL